MKELKTLSEYIDKAEKNEFLIIKNHIESVFVKVKNPPIKSRPIIVKGW